MTRTTRDPSFVAATYNVYHRVKAAAILIVIRTVTADRGVSVWILQEATQRGLMSDLEDAGWETRHAAPEYAIVWDPTRWAYVRHRALVLSPTRYWAQSKGILVVLRDLDTGRRVKFISYHTPAHVQTPRLRAKFGKAWTALRESMRTLKQIARNSRIPVCAAGDDNVDERHGTGWGFMLSGPLEQTQAPGATHGPRRRIDDFRTRGLDVGPGWVVDTPGDHRIHVRRFTYTKRGTRR